MEQEERSQNNFGEYLNITPEQHEIKELQRTAKLRTARLHRKVLMERYVQHGK
jgi:hypothetical protein